MNRHNKGFTLIEIIVTIVISSVLAVMLAQVVANQTWRSYEPIEFIEDAHTLQYVMENIVSDFQQLKKNNAAPLTELKTRLASGHYWSNSTLRNGAGVEAVAAETCFKENSPPSGTFIVPTSCTSSDISILMVTIGITGTQYQRTAFFSH